MSDAPDDEWKAIEAFLAKLREQNRLAAEPAVLQAEWLAARGDLAGAEELLRAETAARPGDCRLWVALSDVVNRRRGTLAAAEVVSKGQLAAGESVELRLARAASGPTIFSRVATAGSPSSKTCRRRPAMPTVPACWPVSRTSTRRFATTPAGAAYLSNSPNATGRTSSRGGLCTHSP